MRNREAARYARWAAITAGLLALIVAGVYVESAIRAARSRHAAPPPVPPTVQQRSAEFSFSKVEQDRTLFTVRASRATEFKDENRSVLEDVWITIYGREGSRNDNIHTRECSYEPKTGNIRCQGEVQIDMEGAKSGSGKPFEKSLEVKTRDLTFSRETGEASTAQPVEFHFYGGQGRAVGVVYNISDSTVRLEHAVDLQLAASPRTEGLPVSLTGTSVEIRRNDRVVVLSGPALVKEGGRELYAEKITIELDPELHARRAVAQGHPEIRAAVGGGEFEVTADQFEGDLSPAGWLERIVADGHVAGTRRSPAGVDQFSTAHVEFAMQPQENSVREMTAGGGVAAESRQDGNSHSLKTDALRVEFVHVRQSAPQQIESAETLTPATIEMKSARETTQLRAAKFAAQFGSDGRLEKLLGHGGVAIERRMGSGSPQTTSAAELSATFRADGEWNTLEETGNVRLEQGDRQASAEQAKIARATDTITLAGAPVISDPVSRTTAASVAVNQTSTEFHATGGVVSTYFAAAQSKTVDLGSGPAHVSAETLSGSTASGHVIYEGQARLWQGAAVLDADRIEVWRDEKKLEASGGVVAVFPQTSGAFGKSAGPMLWEIRAPTLVYWSDPGKAHLEGGVTASSEQGSLESRSLDVFLAPPMAASASSSPPAAAGGGRQVSRVLARGGTVVRQGDRRGTAEQGEYTVADGKFVLSGGEPTLTDASRDTTTGRSLTFFVSNDTILIDSQEGSRTLTKHRVEK